MTKVLVFGTIASTIVTSWGIIGTQNFLFHVDSIWHNFQYWRLVLPSLYAGPFSVPYAAHIYSLFQACNLYEKNPFNTGGGGNSADFLWMVLLGIILFCCIGYCAEEIMIVMSTPLLFMIVYVWCRREPERELSVLTLQYKALYHPWINLFIYMVMGNSIISPLIGIIVGHIYYFFVAILPVSHGYNLIKTPQFCVRIVRMYTGHSAPTGSTYTAPTPTPGAGPAGTQFPSQGAGHQWGRGRALGTG